MTPDAYKDYRRLQRIGKAAVTTFVARHGRMPKQAAMEWHVLRRNLRRKTSAFG